jgi:NADH:ubiquinone oxidoreductase subunit 3 (subunit A)
MENILLSPPIAFLILVAVFLLSSWTSKFIAAKGTESAGKGEAYAGGEDVKNHKVQPDYRQFFPFAFFFTIMHVVVLIVATVPKQVSPLAFIFIVAALLALLILFRK